MANARYFQLHDHIGVEPAFIADKDGYTPLANPRAGELQPLVHENLTIGIPTMVNGNLLAVPKPVQIDAIPGTRILKIDDPIVANAVGELGKYQEIDPPTKPELDKARKATEPARERPASGNPDNNDPQEG